MSLEISTEYIIYDGDDDSTVDVLTDPADDCISIGFNSQSDNADTRVQFCINRAIAEELIYALKRAVRDVEELS